MRAVVVVAVTLTLGCTGRDGFDRALTPVVTNALTPCGTLDSLRDDFDDGVMGEEWRQSGGGGVAVETDGGLDLHPTTPTDTAGYLTDEGFTPSGSVTFEVREMLDTTTDAAFGIYLLNYALGGVGMQQAHGTLSLWTNPSGATFTTLGSAPYDPIAHRWWKLSLDNGAVSAQTSNDGKTWATLVESPMFFTPDLLHVGVAINALGASAPGRVLIDNFNAPGTGAYSNCPIEQLADDFDGAALSTRWEKSFTQNGSTIAESGGNVVITPTLTPNVGGAGLYALNHYDLRGRSVTIRVPQLLTNVFGTESYFRLLVSGGHEAYFVVRNSAIQAYVDSDFVTDEPYDPSLHRCWRFREADGRLFWEVAGDPCASFRTMVSTDRGFTMESVSIIIFGQAFTALPDPGTLLIDSLSSP